MNRKTQQLIRECKAEAAEIIRYANPKSRIKPAIEHITEILTMHVPYSGRIKPIIENIEVVRYTRNDLIKTAIINVSLDNGKRYRISAYQELKGRSPELREQDKTAMFPSGLFRIYHDEIK